MTTKKGIIPASVCIPVYLTPDRWQLKKLLSVDERGSKITRNGAFDCHLSPTGDKWQSKTLFLTIFDLRLRNRSAPVRELLSNNSLFGGQL